MELYLKVRRAYFHQGLSKRAIARTFGISRDSVDKMIVYSVPPGYRRVAPIKRPKLDGFTDHIDQWLQEDVGRPRKLDGSINAISGWFGDGRSLARTGSRILRFAMTADRCFQGLFPARAAMPWPPFRGRSAV